MRTALDKLVYAIKCETERQEWIDWFTFRYEGCVVDYMGHYYFFTYGSTERLSETEDEYCCENFEEMLDVVVARSGKSIRQMLSELPAHDLELHFDSATPPSVQFDDCNQPPTAS